MRKLIISLYPLTRKTGDWLAQSIQCISSHSSPVATIFISLDEDDEELEDNQVLIAGDKKGLESEWFSEQGFYEPHFTA